MDEQNFERRTLGELILTEQREMKKELNSRMDRIENRMDRIENRMDKLEEKFENIRGDIKDIDRKFDSKFDNLRSEMNEKFELLRQEIKEMNYNSKKESTSATRHSQILTSSIVAVVVAVIYSVVK